MKLQETIISRLKRHSFNGEETYRFLMSLATNIFVLVVHLCLLCIYLAAKNDLTATDALHKHTFIYLNIVSIALFLAAFFLIRKRKYLTYGLMLSLEVCAYTVASCILSGLEVYGITNLVLLIMLQIIVPDVKNSLRISVMAATVALLFFCITACFFIAPSFVFSEGLAKLMIAFNISTFLAGAMIQFYFSKVAAAIAAEISENKITELSAQSHTDELTGVFNRRFAKKFFTESVKSGQSYYLAMLDIDDFKVINDSYGHNCGDEVLKFLAQFITQNLRSSDVLVRWGGEEFLIILCDIDGKAAFEVMDALRELLSYEIIKTKENDVQITVTIGISKLTDDLEKSVKTCDLKMYEGKHSGKNIVMI